MAVRTKEEILESVRAVAGEDAGDTVITLLEDVADTMADYDNRIRESGDWKAKYEENDAGWRKRYADRFYGRADGGDPPMPDEPVPDETEREIRSYEDLFKEEA